MGHSPITAAKHYQEADELDKTRAVLAAELGLLPEVEEDELPADNVYRFPGAQVRRTDQR